MTKASGSTVRDLMDAAQDQRPDCVPTLTAADTGPSSSLGPCCTSLDAAALNLQGGVTHLQQLLQNLLQAVQHEREQLQAEKQDIHQERQLLNQERSRVAAALHDNQQVVLNVGGHHFTTTISTLRGAPAPSLFSAMFSGRYELPRAEDGSIFIDRDGRHFADVLNYLRTSQLAYPPDGKDYKYLLELRAEAEYYGLTGLMSIIDRYPYNVTTVVRAGHINTNDCWLYEDGQDEVVLTVDAPCQLLGVGLCGTEGKFSAELEVVEVDAEDYGREVTKLSSAAQTFTRADGAVCRLALAEPVALLPGKCYMLSAVMRGSEGFCCEDCLETVIAGGVHISFQCWESANGTNELRGQFPELYIRAGCC